MSNETTTYCLECEEKIGVSTRKCPHCGSTSTLGYLFGCACITLLMAFLSFVTFKSGEIGGGITASIITIVCIFTYKWLRTDRNKQLKVMVAKNTTSNTIPPLNTTHLEEKDLLDQWQGYPWLFVIIENSNLCTHNVLRQHVNPTPDT